MMQRFLPILLIAIMLALNAACATPNGREAVPDIVERIKSDIRVGMQAEDVEKYFASNNIEYSYMDVEKLAAQPIQLMPPESYEGLKGVYSGIIRNIESNLSVATGIKIHVEIATDGKVRKVEVKDEHSGL